MRHPQHRLLRFYLVSLCLVGSCFETDSLTWPTSPRRRVVSPSLHRPETKLPSIDLSGRRTATPRFPCIGERTNLASRSAKALVIFTATCFSQIRTASASAIRASTLPEPLGLRQLLVGAGMISSVGGLLMSWMGMRHLATDILKASLRCIIQLFLLGAIVLQNILGTTRPLVVWTWIVGVGMLGALEAYSRVEYTYPKLLRHVAASVLLSGLSVLGIALVGGVFGPLTPWYHPRTVIPVAGMLFGNTLSAATLGASTLTKEFVQSRSQVELRLAHGATSREATFPITRSALISSLTPTINGLAVTGVIHIPGMMTGQVLAGQSPVQAAAYQALISVLIATTACATVQLLSRLVTHELMDTTQHRVATENLSQKNDTKKGPLSAPFSFISSRIKKQQLDCLDGSQVNGAGQKRDSDQILHRQVSSDALRLEESGASPTMTADRVWVERANVQVSLSVRPDNRIGITGVSGAGKTQVLRTLIGLEPLLEGELKLGDASPHCISWPEWRRQICWVSQNRPTLTGTPREFLCEIQQYHAQTGSSKQSPESIAAKWGLPESTFERPWNTLSGGEAQRVSLALALSLEPTVLLLDEATNALDSKTALAVEDSLRSSRIPIIMVTHSREQLDRFCTHHVDLSNAKAAVDSE